MAKQAGRFPPNAGKPWSADEDRTFSSLFDSGATIPALAQKFNRTEGGIVARLVRIGKVPDRETARLLGKADVNPGTSAFWYNSKRLAGDGRAFA